MTPNKFHGFIFIITILMFSGCTALKTFPNAARAGDTIALAVGSPKDMTRSNTTAIFTSDSDGIPIDITPNIRSIFNLYADKKSAIYEFGSSTTSIIDSAGHEPWETVVALDLPSGLPVGPGEVQFTTTAQYPDIGSHINVVPISIEILPGTGSANDFMYEFGVGSATTGNLTQLEPLPRADFGPAYPSAACPCPDYGAIEIRVSMPTSFGAAMNTSLMRVIVDDMTAKTGSGRGVDHGLVNGQDLTVLLTSTTGRLKYYEARFSVVLHSAITFSGIPIINSVRYFDQNGVETTGPVVDYTATLQ